MNKQEIYWLEELKQRDSRLQKIESTALSLIKFYFVSVFSLTTVVIGSFNYKVLEGREGWLFLILLFPLLFGICVFNSLKRIVSEHQELQTSRNQISEWFIYGAVKNDFKLSGIYLSPFYTLISWLLILNFFIIIYVAFPFLRSSLLKTAVLVIVGIALAGIMSSVVLVSLNSARKKARDASRRASIASLIPALILYYDKYKQYPIANDFQDMLSKLKEYFNSPISDPLSDKGWKYEYFSRDGIAYNISYTLENGGKVTIGPGDQIK